MISSTALARQTKATWQNGRRLDEALALFIELGVPREIADIKAELGRVHTPRNASTMSAK